MKKLTYDLLIDEIHQMNSIPKSTLRGLPKATIVDIFHNLFGSNGKYDV